jgi:DNA modification methylase
LPTTCKLHQGDFREVLKYIPDGSVDAIITDPPYPAEFLPLWGDLGSFAARVLRPGGLLVAMSGQLHLPAVMKLLEVHLPYRWVIAYMTPGQGPAIHARKIENHWKPVLVYGGTERWLHDVVNSDAPDKEHHDWGQSESGMAALIRLVADPGQMICDPFVGGGTTGVVALDYGCSFTGAELEQEAYEKALTRLAL